ncbi:MaoC family dehydratase [Serratia rubidaea]|uniref:MaoC family dehydratase n=1 Tax=Serratia rubidaea TaxID=61652 RepID=A0ABS0MBW0_SERRU|nr:MaoC family dehydratase [Serratia rubidaea]MBH1929858.1 MaoC family dehydratase [Serratia rubidaea]MEB7586986.1 MaoC family dehydratase [Serratia rubidaea]
MIRQYSPHDIELWANCSGDRNSVHFDKAIARENGLKDIIAQGMLVLLDAKLMLSPYILTDSSINFYLKKPIFVHSDIEFSVRERGGKSFVTVADSDDPAEPCITASVLPQETADFKEGLVQFPINSDFIKNNIEAQIDLLKKSYPHIVDNWLLMDTLLFCLCFNMRKDDYFRRQAEKIAGHSGNIATYHVAHNIFVSKWLLERREVDFYSLSYSVGEKDIYINDDSAYSTFIINANEGDNVIYQSSIGCMTKAYSV